MKWLNIAALVFWILALLMFVIAAIVYWMALGAFIAEFG